MPRIRQPRKSQAKGARAGMIPVYGCGVPGLVVINRVFFQKKDPRKPPTAANLYANTYWRRLVIWVKLRKYLFLKKLRGANANNSKKL